jgi:hypothetical protein
MEDYKQVQKLLGPWTFQDALKERVEREAQVAWALKEDEPFEVIPPMQVKEWSFPSVFVFLRGCLP